MELVWVAALTIAVTVALAAFLNVARISDAVLKAYPDALSLTLSKDGFLSVNQELPYVIDMPLPWRSSSTDDAQSLIIFDSDANVQGVRDVLDRHTLALATETTLYMREQREGVESMRAYPYPKPTQEIVVDESHLQSFFDAVKHHWIVRSHLLVILPAIFIGIVVFIGVTLRSRPIGRESQEFPTESQNYNTNFNHFNYINKKNFYLLLLFHIP